MTTSFASATEIKAVDPYTYSTYFHPDWCNGSVPHGGYVTSCMLVVAKSHFSSTRLSSNQPHTIALQLSFLRRASVGPAIFIVTELKLGQRTSTISISLVQKKENPYKSGEHNDPSVIGYFTQSNIDTESGLCLTIPHTLLPPPLSVSSNKDALRQNIDPNWTRFGDPFVTFRRAGKHVQRYLPREGGAKSLGLLDQWMSMSNGQRFTQETLGYVADSFPHLVESDDEVVAEELGREAKRLGLPNLSNRGTTPTNNLPKTGWGRFWYPTIVLNLEIKKVLPREGVEWLFSRVRIRQIRNGRMDIEVIVLDEEGDLVALSNHVALVVGVERNVNRGDGSSERRRGSETDGKGKSKL